MMNGMAAPTVRFGFAHGLGLLFCGCRLTVLEACRDPRGSESRALSSHFALDRCPAPVQPARLLTGKRRLALGTARHQVQAQPIRALRANPSIDVFGLPLTTSFDMIPSMSTVPGSRYLTGLSACRIGSLAFVETAHDSSALTLIPECAATCRSTPCLASMVAIIETSCRFRSLGSVRHCQAELFVLAFREDRPLSSLVVRKQSTYRGVLP